VEVNVLVVVVKDSLLEDFEGVGVSWRWDEVVFFVVGVGGSGF